MVPPPQAPSPEPQLRHIYEIQKRIQNHIPRVPLSDDSDLEEPEEQPQRVPVVRNRSPIMIQGPILEEVTKEKGEILTKFITAHLDRAMQIREKHLENQEKKPNKPKKRKGTTRNLEALPPRNPKRGAKSVANARLNQKMAETSGLGASGNTVGDSEGVPGPSTSLDDQPTLSSNAKKQNTLKRKRDSGVVNDVVMTSEDTSEATNTSFHSVHQARSQRSDNMTSEGREPQVLIQTTSAFSSNIGTTSETSRDVREVVGSPINNPTPSSSQGVYKFNDVIPPRYDPDEEEIENVIEEETEERRITPAPPAVAPKNDGRPRRPPAPPAAPKTYPGFIRASSEVERHYDVEGIVIVDEPVPVDHDNSQNNAPDDAPARKLRTSRAPRRLFSPADDNAVQAKAPSSVPAKDPPHPQQKQLRMQTVSGPIKLVCSGYNPKLGRMSYIAGSIEIPKEPTAGPVAEPVSKKVKQATRKKSVFKDPDVPVQARSRTRIITPIFEDPDFEDPTLDPAKSNRKRPNPAADEPSKPPKPQKQAATRRSAPRRPAPRRPKPLSPVEPYEEIVVSSDSKFRKDFVRAVNVVRAQRRNRGKKGWMFRRHVKLNQEFADTMRVFRAETSDKTGVEAAIEFLDREILIAETLHNHAETMNTWEYEEGKHEEAWDEEPLTKEQREALITRYDRNTILITLLWLQEQRDDLVENTYTINLRNPMQMIRDGLSKCDELWALYEEQTVQTKDRVTLMDIIEKKDERIVNDGMYEQALNALPKTSTGLHEFMFPRRICCNLGKITSMQVEWKRKKLSEVLFKMYTEKYMPRGLYLQRFLLNVADHLFFAPRESHKWQMYSIERKSIVTDNIYCTSRNKKNGTLIVDEPSEPVVANQDAEDNELDPEESDSDNEEAYPDQDPNIPSTSGPIIPC